MQRRKLFHNLLIILLAGSIPMVGQGLYAMEMDFQGQLSAWITGTEIRGEWEHDSGLRYIPQADLTHPVNADSTMDLQLALNGFAISGSGPYKDDTDVKLYRASLRYATVQTETRLGLQKINFGPARILRSLRWFDRLDPTDPIQFTEGVYALRFRYVGLNNANLWLWGLYDNDETKGYEVFPTSPDTVETGGRLQVPLLQGEMAATFHTRRADGGTLKIPDFRENRFALDGRWDVGVGLWFESVLQQQKTGYIPYEWSKRITLGMDYTFDIGNGIYTLIEHMGVGFSEKASGWSDDLHISAVYASYPVGVLDQLTAIGYYYWDQGKYYQYMNWSRTYDNITLSFSLFYYPEVSAEPSRPLQDMMTGGRGGQFMVIWNH